MRLRHQDVETLLSRSYVEGLKWRPVDGMSTAPHGEMNRHLSGERETETNGRTEDGGNSSTRRPHPPWRHPPASQLGDHQVQLALDDAAEVGDDDLRPLAFVTAPAHLVDGPPLAPRRSPGRAMFRHLDASTSCCALISASRVTSAPVPNIPLRLPGANKPQERPAERGGWRRGE